MPKISSDDEVLARYTDSTLDGDSDFAAGIAEIGSAPATIDGPGPVWLQSLPFSWLAGRVASAMPGISGSSKGEGSLLGGLGEMLMGD